jgi:hypothetical protein
MELEVREERWQPFFLLRPAEGNRDQTTCMHLLVARDFLYVTSPNFAARRQLSMILLLQAGKLGRLIQTSAVSIKTLCPEQKESR